MKLEPKTMDVLKSFSTINPSLFFRKGDNLATISPSRTIMAKAKLDQEFTREFAIYDLPRFLGVLSLFKDPDLALGEGRVKISSGAQKIQYTYADPTAIVSAPDNEPKLPTKDVSCLLTAAAFKSVQNATSALGVPEIAIVGDGEKIHVQAFDSKNDTSHLFSMEIGETKKEFTIVFKAEYLKLLSQDYLVTISSEGISHWKGDFIEYWIAVQSKESDFSKL